MPEHDAFDLLHETIIIPVSIIIMDAAAVHVTSWKETKRAPLCHNTKASTYADLP